MSGEITKLSIHKDITCCIEQIPEAPPPKKKTVAVRPLLTNHPNKTSKIRWSPLKNSEHIRVYLCVESAK